MDENLELDRDFRAFLNFVAAHLAREHNALEAHLMQRSYARGCVHAHLRRGVQRQVGRDFACEPRDSHVLDDKRVRVGFGGGFYRVGELFELVIKYYSVERYVQLYAVNVAVGDGSFQLAGVEIMRRRTRGELLFSHINRVRARTDGGNDALKAARGR